MRKCIIVELYFKCCEKPISGLLAPIWSMEELERLDEREQGYLREVIIPSQQVDIIHEGFNRHIQRLSLQDDDVKNSFSVIMNLRLL